jgi:hypothetical protein
MEWIIIAGNNKLKVKNKDMKVKATRMPNVIPQKKYVVILEGMYFVYTCVIVYRDNKITIIVDNKAKEVLCVDTKQFDKMWINYREYTYYIKICNVSNSDENFDLMNIDDKWNNSLDNESFINLIPPEQYYIIAIGEFDNKAYEIIFKNLQIVVLKDTNNNCIILEIEEFYECKATIEGESVNFNIFRRQNINIEQLYISSEVGDQKPEKEEMNLEYYKYEGIQRKKEEYLQDNIVEGIKTSEKMMFVGFVEIQGKNISNIIPNKDYLVMFNKVKCKLIYKDENVSILLSENNKTLTIPTFQFESDYFEKDKQRVQLKILEKKATDAESAEQEIKLKIDVDDISLIAEELFKNLDQLIEI